MPDFTLPAPVVLRWLEAEGWRATTGEARLDDVGVKAIGLAEVPSAWGIPWVVLPTSACSIAERESQWRAVAECLLRHFSETGEQLNGGLIARSSGPDESIDMRGQLDSVPCAANAEALANALRRVALQIRDDEYETPGSVVCAVVVQPFVRPEYRGHLSNEYRHAQRNVDFLYEVEALGGPAGTTQLKTFRLQRPVAAPEQEALVRPIESATAANVEQSLRLVGSWLAARNVRGHIEWLCAQGYLRLVQLDIDPLPPKIVPMSEAPTPAAGAPPAASAVGSAFVAINCGEDFSGLRKTRSHALLQAAGAFIPAIFVARNVGDRIRNIQSDFWRELTYLLATPAIIRFDVPLERTEWTNLPTIGPLTSTDDVAQKVLKAVDSVIARGVNLGEVSVVVHHFIAARAAAWSEASPSSQQVRIDAIWGLPDGLQSLVHDSIIYDMGTTSIAPQIRYKDRFIDVAPAGTWLVRRAPPSLAGEEVCNLNDTQTISDISIKVARAANRTVRIMWFLDVLKGGGQDPAPAMPWIVVELEESAETVAPWHGTHAASTMLRRQAELHTERAIRNRATLAKFRRNPVAMDLGGRHVLLQPDASTVRDRSFFADFAAAVGNLPHQWKVLYAGSMLAHAPYQLQQLGIAVLALHQEVRPPRRTYMRKLVRDGIPARIAGGGEQAEVVKLDNREYQLALRQKLVEEALEVVYSSDSDELREELADLLTVAQALCENGAVGRWSEVEKAAADKTTRRGAFEARLFLRSTGFSLRSEPPKPGGAQVERLRSGNGLRVPLVPPLLSGERESVFEFRRFGVQVAIEFREQHVFVRLVAQDRRRERQSSQLSLFDESDDDDDE